MPRGFAGLCCSEHQCEERSFLRVLPTRVVASAGASVALLLSLHFGLSFGGSVAHKEGVPRSTSMVGVGSHPCVPSAAGTRGRGRRSSRLSLWHPGEGHGGSLQLSFKTLESAVQAEKGLAGERLERLLCEEGPEPVTGEGPLCLRYHPLRWNHCCPVKNPHF